MDWKLFSSELKKQMNSVGISGRTLSEKIDKSPSYINQILNGRVRKVTYETSRMVFEQLNLIDKKLLNYYLHLLDVELPDDILDSVKNSNMLNNSLTLNQCYKNAWGTQEKEATKDDTPYASDFYTNEERAEIDKSRMELDIEERNYLSSYSWHKQQELKETIKQINVKLNLYLEESFDPNDYTDNHDAEFLIETLKGMFDIDNKNTPPMFQFFLNLMHLPLQTITNSKTQNEILEFIKEKCILEYVFQGIPGMDNDSVEPNQLYLDYKQPTKD